MYLDFVLQRLLILLSLIALSSCELVTALGEEHASVADTTEHWSTSISSRKLLANVTIDDGWVIEGVRAYSTRHFWPGRAQAHVTDATLITSGPNVGLWQAVPEDAAFMPQADRVFYQWVVSYRLASGQDILEATLDAPASLVVSCTQQQIDLTYDAIRLVMNGLQSSDGNLNLGFQGPAHFGPVSLQGQGVPFARQATVGGQLVPIFASDVSVLTPADPDLLLYAPRSREADETTDEYRAAITDAFPDSPYKLLGVAYGANHSSATRRPRLGCIPSDEWFVHEAGYHQADGGFEATPPNEAVLGEIAVSSGGAIMGQPPAWAPSPSETSPIWHPRLWDLHFWIAENGNGKPVMEINVPQGQVGIPVQGGFFEPETFE